MGAMRAARGPIAATLCAFGLPALAEPANCGTYWTVDDIPALTLGTVKPAEKRAYFVSDGIDGCPSAAPACRRKDYLIGGDTVVIEDRSGDFVCATFVNAKRTATVGWLPAAAIEPVTAAPATEPSAFVGRWERAYASIRIVPGKGGRLSISGDATYPTAGGSVNLGEIAADAAPKDGEAYFATAADGKTVPPAKADQYDCVVRFRRLGPYLVAADNMFCGGHNVTFTGVYTKR